MTTPSPARGPLAGIRVLDLSRILAGPWATQCLADLGAEVIKVERPGAGDDTRQMGPPFVRDGRSGERGDAAYFLAANRGKQSVEIDIATPDGRRLVETLAARCDVLVENYKVGGLAKHGLDYETLHAKLPDLVYCSVTGFGQSGPYRHRAGYDYLIQAMGGLMSLTGEADDRPGGGPQRVGVALADILSGMYAAVAILAALRHRDAGGGGQHIDIGMLDVQVAVLANQAQNYLTTGVPPRRMGAGHPNIVPYQPFAAADGHLVLAVGNDAQFRRMCRAMGRPELADDARYGTIADRVAHRDSLVPALEAAFRERTVDEWVALMESVEVPCGPINTLDRVFADPQVRARGLRLELVRGDGQAVPSLASPIRLGGALLPPGGAPPLLGEHTDAVLRRVAGLGPAELAALRATGAIGRAASGSAADDPHGGNE